MAAFHPRLDELPSEFAVFPLTGALLLPRGKLPLNIFEPRYLAMVLDALQTRRVFGMIQADPNAGGDEPGCIASAVSGDCRPSARQTMGGC